MPIPLLLAGAAIKGLVGLGQALFSGKKDKQKKANAAIDATEVYTADPLVKARLNAPMPGEAEATQEIGKSATQALGAAKTRKGGLASVGAIQAGTNKAKQDLAVQKGKMKIGAEQAMGAERSKEFQSRQQKQTLKTQVALGDLAGAKAAQAQGLAMVGSAVSDIAGGAAGGGGGKSGGGLFKRKSQAFVGGGGE